MARVTYPLALDIEGRRCLVAGGGAIAADKVDGLPVAGAQVVVVSPAVLSRIADLAERGAIEYHRRTYRSEDLDGVYLAYGATDDPAVNERIATEARERGILVNAVDDPPNCDFYAVAVVRRGDLQIGISTNGRSPAFARWLREDLDASLPVEYGPLLAALSEARREVRAGGTALPYEAWGEAISAEVTRQRAHGTPWGARERIRDSLMAAAGRYQASARPGAQTATDTDAPTTAMRGSDA